MTLLRSALFNLAFYAWGLGMHLICLPLLLLPRGATQWAGGLWVRGVLALLAALCGIRHEIRGREHLPPRPNGGAFIVASKHQSAWDTLIYSLLLDDEAYVLKQELIWFPLFGLFLLKSGVVPVDRAGGGKALRKMVAAAKRFVAEGRPLVIFPEGTRTPPGSRRPYHPGVAALYRQLEVPVVPVALNSGLLWGRNSFVKTPGTIVLEFLPAIEPGLDRKAFLATLEDRIETASDRLAGLAAPDEGTTPASSAATR